MPKKAKVKDEKVEPKTKGLLHLTSDEADSETASEKLERLVLENSNYDFSLNTKFLCKWSEGIFYEAKIIQIDVEDGENLYLVTYPGWAAKYNNEIKESDLKKFFLPITEENAKLAKEAIKDAKQKKAKKKPQKKRKSGGKTELKAQTSPKVVTQKKTFIKTKKPKVIIEDKQWIIPDPTVENKKHALPNGHKVLDSVLIQDARLMSFNKRKPVFPARICVKQIVEDFKNHVKNKYLNEKAEPDMEVLQKTMTDLDSIIKYFNIIVESDILYKSEKKRYQKVLRKYEERRGKLQKETKEDCKESLDLSAVKRERSGSNLNIKLTEIVDIETLLKTSPSNDLLDDKSKILPIKDEVDQVAVDPVETSIVNEFLEKRTRNQPQKNFSLVKERKRTIKPKETLNLDEAFDCTDKYGFVYLVRYFYTLAILMKSKRNLPKFLTKRMNLIDNFIVYLAENKDKYYNVEEDYNSPSKPMDSQNFRRKRTKLNLRNLEMKRRKVFGEIGN
uniref:MRG domain-containing protein n=1 Tax=Panagrolaimus sp. JU765 TaxID=591449 RepID=A0AC34R2G4_9BILA